MIQEVEAVYENGVLRPVHPLSLSERQKVQLTISDVPSALAIEDALVAASASGSSEDVNPTNVGRILPVVAHAVAVFGDEQKASHWLATPLPIFGDRSPSQLLDDVDGVQLVEQVLSRIEHNIPS